MKNKPLVKVFLLMAVMAAAVSLLQWNVLTMPVSADAKKDDTDEETIRTMDTETLIYGEEEPGTAIIISVYNYRNGLIRATLYTNSFVVGESGMYVVSAPLPVLGEQYVSVAVNGRGRATRYYRYESDLGQTLSETYLNVYEFLSEEPR